MADQDIRIPKGILKNKYGSSSRDSGEISDKSGIGASYGGSSIGSGWDQDPHSQIGMIGGRHPMPVAPVAAPQHGMNMPNPVMDPVMRGLKSEYPSPTQQKMFEFINNKRELLFRPLDPDETPMSEVKGTQRNTEDHYGIVPSFDHFLRVDPSEIKQYFYQNVQVGDIVIGKVLSRSSTGLYVLLLCSEGGKHMILEDLNVRAFCPVQQTIPVADARDPSRYYDIDDYVRLELLEINKDSGRLNVGMKGSTLTAEMQHSFQLGLISRRDLPRYYELSKNGSDPRVRRTYHEMLQESPGFQNPNSVSHLASNMGIYNNSNSLMKGIRSGFPAHEKATQLRRVQNVKWAHIHVADGIKYFKQQKFTEAFQSLNSALNIDGENVEALVTRGALFASLANYDKAIDDFETALKYNPHHSNARKYLAETLVALGRQQETQGKLEDAIASYSKSVVIKADHKEAKEALWSLHARTEKLDPTKMTIPAAAKAAELKAKLKTILQSELGGKMESKPSKDKKSKKDKRKKDSSGSEDDSSSSSSSDESSSDSSSSGSGYKKRSKKRKKKKSKKSKKARRESITSSDRKPRDLSLSPFSKRLAEPGGGMPSAGTGYSGFTDSTYAELQLGIFKNDHEKEDLDDVDSKRSSKKGKEKKRSKKSKEKKKKKKKSVSTDSSSSDSETERSKKKSKKQPEPEEVSLQAILPDLGDLEAKLSAYYSKIEQGKIETKLPASHRSRSRSRSRGRERERERSRSPVLRKRPRDYDDVPPRTIENIPAPKVEEIPQRIDDETKPWSERKSGKIDLQTDEYGNIIQNQTIVRTVKNDIPSLAPEASKASKFEMKFKPLSDSVKGENGTSVNAVQAAPDVGSKWRPLGVAAPPSEAIRNAFERPSSPRSDADKKIEKDANSARDDKSYRKRSRSSSGSPARRRRRSRSRSFSRSRSRSRSRSKSHSRSRSRDRSPSRRDRDRRPYHGGQRGRAPVRFFRGYNYSRGGGGGRRPYNTRPSYNRDRDYGGGGNNSGGGRSRFRNRFSRTPSRSKSRSRSRDRKSRSRSVSPRDRRRRDRSPDRVRRQSPLIPRRDPTHSQESTTSSRMEADSMSQSQEDRSKGSDEIQIGSLRASSAADLEVLLDKRNAEKKEEMRKSNPDFFRAT